MESLWMQPRRYSKLYLVTPIDYHEEMEPVVAIPAHLADNFITNRKLGGTQAISLSSLHVVNTYYQNP